MSKKPKKLLHIEEWPGEVTKCGKKVAELNFDTDRHGSLLGVMMTPPGRFEHCEPCFTAKPSDE